MATLEQGLEQQEVLNMRSMKPSAAQRIILRLTSYQEHSQLSWEDAAKFNRTLHQEHGKPGYKFTYQEGSYYLDFDPAPMDEDRSSLRTAVDRTSLAIYESRLPAAVVRGWLVDADSPQVSELYPDDWQRMEPVTDSATEMFQRHQTEMFSNIFDRMLFEPDFA
jgi:hypothetical protein